MTRRDVGMLCNFTTPTALREIAQPYRFWGLLGFPPRSGRIYLVLQLKRIGLYFNEVFMAAFLRVIKC